MNKQYRVKRKPIKCPNCGNKTVATILWGMPAIDKVQDDINNGKIVLGGCCLEEDDPLWQCTSCDIRIHKMVEIEIFNEMISKFEK